MITKEIIEYLSCSADCFYIYDEEIIISQIKKLKSNFHNIKFLYSIKANPNLDVLKSILYKHSYELSAAYGSSEFKLTKKQYV